jgi:hypothetical protein
MVKLTDIELPVVFKNQLLFRAGNWNNWNISSEEVNKSILNTKWNKINSSLIYSHKDKEAEAWAGKIVNPYSDGHGSVYGDVYVYDPNAAVALKYGEAPFAISAGIAWSDKFDQPTNFFYRNFCLVADPGVRDRDIFLNFSAGETKDGFKTANFSAVMDSSASQGSAQNVNTNGEIAYGDEDKKKKKKVNMENESEESEKLEESDESKKNKEAVIKQKEINMGCDKKKEEEFSELIEDEKKDKSEDEDEDKEEVKKENFEKSENELSEDDIIKFLKEHPNPEDDEVHKFAESKGMEVDDVEEIFYKLATKFVNGGNKELKHGNDEDGKFDGEQLKKGIEVEKEHTDNEEMAKQIAKAHLAEIPDYYTRLNKMEEEAKNIKKEDMSKKDSKEDKIDELLENIQYNNKRRLIQDKSSMETEKVMSSMNSNSANFESEKPVEKQEVTEAKPVEKPVEQVKEVPKELPQPEKVIMASPVMDEKIMDQVVNRISDKLLPVLKPAPMTVREFGSEQSDPVEDTVERLAKSLFKSKNG